MTETRPHLTNDKEPRQASPHDDDDVRYSQAAVGHRLRAARIACGITERTAAACEVSLRTYRKWGAGGAQKNWHDQLSLFANKFGVSLTWIVLGAGDPPKNPADGKIAFLSVKPPRPKTAPRVMTAQELREQYEAMTVQQKVALSLLIQAFEASGGTA
jgi:hypothetical protein